MPLINQGLVKTPSEDEPFLKTKTEWMSDQHFADQRLAGTNPFGLKKITFSGEGKTCLINVTKLGIES